MLITFKLIRLNPPIFQGFNLLIQYNRYTVDWLFKQWKALNVYSWVEPVLVHLFLIRINQHKDQRDVYGTETNFLGKSEPLFSIGHCQWSNLECPEKRNKPLVVTDRHGKGWLKKTRAVVKTVRDLTKNFHRAGVTVSQATIWKSQIWRP